MEVILTEDVPALGEAGEIVNVKRGYGRNYLLPKGLAMLATSSRVADMEHKRRVIEERQKKEVAKQQGVAGGIGKVALAFDVQSNEEGKLFGSVTNQDVHAKLREAGYVLDRRKIRLAEPIKQVGEYTVEIALHREVVVTLPISVTSSQVIATPEPEESILGAPELGDDDDDRPPRHSDDEPDASGESEAPDVAGETTAAADDEGDPGE